MKSTTRLLLLGSLATNVVLITAFIACPARFSRGIAHGWRETRGHTIAAARDPDGTGPGATAERVADFWRSLDSSNLRTLTTNLRIAGFSPAMVEAMVEVRIDALLIARVDAEAAIAADAPFWKPAPFILGSEDASTFYSERIRMLREALRTDSPPEARLPRRLRLGEFSGAKGEAVARIERDYREMREAGRSADDWIELPEDRERTFLLNRAQRADLVALLTPEELETYDMRRWGMMRPVTRALSLMNGTEDEYRTIYRVHQPFADVLEPSVRAPDQPERRREAQRRIAAELKIAFGESRYGEYVRSSNREFQDLYVSAARADFPLEAAIEVFNRRGDFADESRRVFEASELSLDQKRGALASLAQRIRVEIARALGPAAGENYTRMAGWITEIEHGAAVTMEPDGSMKTFGNLSAASPVSVPNFP